MGAVTSHAAVEISRLWCTADHASWVRAVAACHERGLRLVDVIAARHRWYRDACARRAFDRRLPAWHIAREWRIARARGAPIVIQVSGARGGERRGIGGILSICRKSHGSGSLSPLLSEGGS